MSTTRCHKHFNANKVNPCGNKFWLKITSKDLLHDKCQFKCTFCRNKMSTKSSLYLWIWVDVNNEWVNRRLKKLKLKRTYNPKIFTKIH